MGRGGKTPNPQTKQSLAAFGQMVRAEHSWICYCPNWNHIGVLFSGGARDALRGGAGRRAPLQKCRAVEILQKATRDSSTSWAVAAAPGSGMGRHLPAAWLRLALSQWELLQGMDRPRQRSWSLGKHVLLRSSWFTIWQIRGRSRSHRTH